MKRKPSGGAYKYDMRGGVYEHVLVVVRARCGKPLPPKAIVHHVNGDGRDNRASNLVVCNDHAYHMLLHRRIAARAACGNPHWERCRICGIHSEPSTMRKSGRRKTTCLYVHPECRHRVDQSYYYRNQEQYRERARRRYYLARAREALHV